MTRRAVIVALAAIVFATVLLSAFIGHIRPLAPAAADVDQHFYLAMARAPFRDSADTRHAPFCWRVLPPLLAGLAPTPERGFRIVTVVSLALLPIAVFRLSYRVGCSTPASLTAAALTGLAPPIVGLTSWDPIRPDPLGTLLLTLAATAAIERRAVLAALLMILAALTKETAVIAACFALVWAAVVDRRAGRASLVAAAAAVVTLIAIHLLIPRANAYGYARAAADLYATWSPRNLARRMLLATGSTWNVLLPAAAWGALRNARPGIAAAATAAVLVSTAQVLVSWDIQRVVAAGWPFVVVLVACALDEMGRTASTLVAVSCVVAQVPWLIDYAGLASVPLRAVEIVIVLATPVVAVIAARRA